MTALGELRRQMDVTETLARARKMARPNESEHEPDILIVGRALLELAERLDRLEADLRKTKSIVAMPLQAAKHEGGYGLRHPLGQTPPDRSVAKE